MMEDIFSFDKSDQGNINLEVLQCIASGKGPRYDGVYLRHRGDYRRIGGKVPHSMNAN